MDARGNKPSVKLKCGTQQTSTSLAIVPIYTRARFSTLRLRDHKSQTANIRHAFQTVAPARNGRSQMCNTGVGGPQQNANLNHPSGGASATHLVCPPRVMWCSMHLRALRIGGGTILHVGWASRGEVKNIRIRTPLQAGAHRSWAHFIGQY